MKEFRCEICNGYMDGFGSGECPQCNKLVCCFSFWKNKCAECEGTDCDDLKYKRIFLKFSTMIILILIYALIKYGF